MQPIGKQIRDEIRASTKIRFPGWVKFWGFAVIFVISFLAHSRGTPALIALGLPVINALLVLVVTIAVKWRLRHSLWFWITMTTIAALHFALLLFVPWPTHWVPAGVITAFAFVDFVIIVTILAVVERSLS